MRYKIWFDACARLQQVSHPLLPCPSCGKQRCLLIQRDHMLCHFTIAIGHVSPQCHPCKQEIDLNSFPRLLRGHVPLSACVGICQSIKLLLAALPIQPRSLYPPLPDPPTATLLIWAPTAQRPGCGLNEPLSSAGRHTCFFIQILKPYITKSSPPWSPGRLCKSWMYSWGWSHTPCVNPRELLFAVFFFFFHFINPRITCISIWNAEDSLSQQQFSILNSGHCHE